MDELNNISNTPFGNSVASITEAKKNQLTFCDRTDQQGIDLINNTKASYVLCSDKLDINTLNDRVDRYLLFSVNPKLEFVKICHKYFSKQKKKVPNTYISPNVKIGSNVSIGSKNIRIEDGTQIHDNVTIYDNVHIGKNCVIKAGAVIGGDGFGYVQDINGSWLNFPHYGKVIIKDNVHIGSNTCIDRGSLSDTIIETGVRIDNLIHIAHNVKIGQNSIVIALAMLGGSSQFGRNVWIAPSSSIREGKCVGDNSMVGLGAVVVSDIHENSIVIGNPAKFYKKRSGI